MASDAGRAMYPHLAAKEQQSATLVDRSQNRGEWAKSTDPMWQPPQQGLGKFAGATKAPMTTDNLMRVPGLRYVGPNRR
jgi:hypothetical protein